MPHPYHWLLFDADDTLLDYQGAELAALARVFEQIDILLTDDNLARYRRINQALWHALERGETTQARLTVQRFEQLAAELGIGVDAARLSLDYMQHVADCTVPIAGAETVVRALRGKYRIGIVSNGFTRVKQQQLAATGFADCLEEIVISEAIGAAKPDRAFFDTAFSRLGQPPREAVMIIGDSLSSDIAGGHAYGIDTCWYNPKQRELPASPQPTYTIARLEQLLELLL